MVSGNAPTEIRHDPESGEWLSRSEFMAKTGVIERTLTNRIKNGYYKSRLNAKGEREVFYNEKSVPENRPEAFQQASGKLPESVAGKAKGDPETTFQNDRKIAVLDPEFSRSGPCESCERLQGRVQLLQEQLKAVEIAYAKLEGQMDGKDALLLERDRVVDSLKETVSAKEQSVNATQAAYLNLQEQFHQLQEKQVPALPTSASVSDESEVPKNIWGRLLGVIKS